MTDRSKLKLHPGSFWNNGGVTSECGNEVWITDGLLDVNGLDSVEISDALAVIRAAGLDPEFAELEKAREKIAELERAPSVPTCATCPRFVPPDTPESRHGWCRHPTLNLETDVPPDGSGYCWRHPEAKKGSDASKSQ